MEKVKVSIVAPVYNVAPYLPNFIDSVLNQTYHNWELLLVDDGSTDESGRICDDYLRIDNRIRVIHQPNNGVSSARNAGIKETSGDWLLLPDADDLLSLDALETLLSYAKEDVGLVCAAYTRYVQGEMVPEKVKSETKKVSVCDYVDEIGRLTGARNIDRYCWNKLFRLSIIKENKILFDEDLSYREDILYIYQFLLKCTQMVQCISYDMYYYYMRDDGANVSLKRRYEPKSDGRFLAMTRCYNLLEQIGASTETKKRMQNEITNAYFALITLMKKSRVGFFSKERIGVRKVLLNYISPAEFVSIGKDFLLRRVKKLFII